MKTVGVVARHEDRKVDRDRRAVRRRRRHRAVDQPDLDRHLQDPDRAQGALRHRHQPAPVGGALHHADGRGHGRGGAARRAARRRDRLDDDRDARGHAGADEAARGRGDPGDRRHGPGARRLQRRQAGLRRRPGQRARATSSGPPTSPRPPTTSSPARRFDNGVLCSSPNSVVVDQRGRRVRSGGSSRPRAATSCAPAETDALARVLVTPQRLPNPALVGKSAAVHRREGRHRACRRTRGC